VPDYAAALILARHLAKGRRLVRQHLSEFKRSTESSRPRIRPPWPWSNPATETGTLAEAIVAFGDLACARPAREAPTAWRSLEEQGDLKGSIARFASSPFGLIRVITATVSKRQLGNSQKGGRCRRRKRGLRKSDLALAPEPTLPSKCDGTTSGSESSLEI